MYFDLEFSQKENEGRDVDEMVDILISVILEALHEKYAIEGQEEWIVELDSSTKGIVAVPTASWLWVELCSVCFSFILWKKKC